SLVRANRDEHRWNPGLRPQDLEGPDRLESAAQCDKLVPATRPDSNWGSAVGRDRLHAAGPRTALVSDQHVHFLMGCYENKRTCQDRFKRSWPCEVLLAAALACTGSVCSSSAAPAVITGTSALTIDEPLDEVMVAGIDRFALKELAASPARRD